MNMSNDIYAYAYRYCSSFVRWRTLLHGNARCYTGLTVKIIIIWACWTTTENWIWNLSWKHVEIDNGNESCMSVLICVCVCAQLSGGWRIERHAEPFIALNNAHKMQERFFLWLEEIEYALIRIICWIHIVRREYCIYLINGLLRWRSMLH